MTMQTAEPRVIETTSSHEAIARAPRRQAGMTLIEIMIVLAIIALVMGLLVGPAVINSLHDARVRTARLMSRQIEGAYARWSMDTNETCPDSLDALKPALGRRVSDTIKDPWGHEYVLKCGDTAPDACAGRLCSLSVGRDGKEGTEDDIKSWTEATQ